MTQSFQVLEFLVQGIQLEEQGYSGDLLSVVLKTPFVKGVYPVQTYGQTAYFPGRDKASRKVAGFRVGNLKGLVFFITLMVISVEAAWSCIALVARSKGFTNLNQ